MKVAIIGRGMAGLSCAFRLYQRTTSLELFGSSENGQRASNAAQGVICNKGLLLARSPLFHGKLQSLRWVKDWLHDIEKVTAKSIAKNFAGIYEPFHSQQDYQTQAKRIYRENYRGCFRSHLCRGTYLPSLACKAHLFYPEDGWFDCRSMIEILESYLPSRGVQITNRNVERISLGGHQVELVFPDQSTKSFDHVIVASGSGTAVLAQNSKIPLPKIFPVSGQILSFSSKDLDRDAISVKGIHSLILHQGKGFLGSTSIKTATPSAEEREISRQILEVALANDFGYRQSLDSVSEIWGTRIRVKDRMPYWGVHPDSRCQRKVSFIGGFFKNGLQFSDYLAKATVEELLGKPTPAFAEHFHLNRLY